jgi:CRP-like cAMP-binding protein
MLHQRSPFDPRCGPAGPLVAKLETVTALPAEDREALTALCSEARELGARRTVIREGDRPDFVHLILDGWAARYSLLGDGGRQITAFLIPGDFCDLHVTILGAMDHSIATLTRAAIAYVPRAAIEALTARPAVARAFWWATLVDEAVLRAWLVNVGRRDAGEAIGHLMCELYLRMRNVGLTTDHSYALPLTQEEIADALGLTPVHVNRVLQRMRREGLISFAGGALTIHDYRRLEKASGFNPNYLHFEQRASCG